MYIQTYVQNLTEKRNLPGVITPEGDWYIVNGERVSSQDVALLYPTKGKLRSILAIKKNKGKNIDGRRVE